MLFCVLSGAMHYPVFNNTKPNPNGRAQICSMLPVAFRHDTWRGPGALSSSMWLQSRRIQVCNTGQDKSGEEK